jgi:hypothetical protein
VNRGRRLICALLSGLGAVLLIFGGRPGVAAADVVGPSLPLPSVDSWTTWVVVGVCVVAVAAVVTGVIFLRRAAAKRRASGPGGGL